MKIGIAVKSISPNSISNLINTHSLKCAHQAHFLAGLLYQVRISSKSPKVISLILIWIYCVHVKQCRSWSTGFIRSQLIWVYTFFKKLYEVLKMFYAEWTYQSAYDDIWSFFQAQVLVIVRHQIVKTVVLPGNFMMQAGRDARHV